jgi:ABC-type multidrug transport system fused ATPase/permease subunit
VMLLPPPPQWTVRQSAEVSNQMVSVERVLYYCNLEQEAPLHSAPGTGPPTHWPHAGAIEARAACATYRQDLKPVLQKLSFAVAGGEKVRGRRDPLIGLWGQGVPR